MKKKILDLILFIISIVCLTISLKLLWNMGIFCDEFNTSPDKVCGGEIELMLYWGRILLIFIACIISGIKLLKRKQ